MTHQRQARCAAQQAECDRDCHLPPRSPAVSHSHPVALSVHEHTPDRLRRKWHLHVCNVVTKTFSLRLSVTLSLALKAKSASRSRFRRLKASPGRDSPCWAQQDGQRGRQRHKEATESIHQLKEQGPREALCPAAQVRRYCAEALPATSACEGTILMNIVSDNVTIGISNPVAATTAMHVTPPSCRGLTVFIVLGHKSQKTSSIPLNHQDKRFEELLYLPRTRRRHE